VDTNLRPANLVLIICDHLINNEDVHNLIFVYL
jgi:hypothetical protein